MVPCGCLHGGTCVTDVSFPAGSGKYLCVCPEGKQGELCHQDVDECSSAPCGGGSCINTADGFRCECPAGLRGETEVSRIQHQAEPCCFDCPGFTADVASVFFRFLMHGRRQRVREEALFSRSSVLQQLWLLWLWSMPQRHVGTGDNVYW